MRNTESIHAVTHATSHFRESKLIHVENQQASLCKTLLKFKTVLFDGIYRPISDTCKFVQKNKTHNLNWQMKELQSPYSWRQQVLLYLWFKISVENHFILSNLSCENQSNVVLASWDEHKALGWKKMQVIYNMYSALCPLTCNSMRHQHTLQSTYS